MTPKSAILAAVGFCIYAVLSTPSWAKEIKVISPEAMEAGCKKTGGTYLRPEHASTGAYGCISGNGTVTVCGGESDKQKKSCTQALVQGTSNQTNVGQRLLKRATFSPVR